MLERNNNVIEQQSYRIAGRGAKEIAASVEAAITARALTPGQRLPTVRQLAADLGLAANTVARSYRELEADGVIATRGRRGTFVSSRLLDAEGETPRRTDAWAAAACFTTTARRLGLSLAEATRLVENSWTQTARPGGS